MFLTLGVVLVAFTAVAQEAPEETDPEADQAIPIRYVVDAIEVSGNTRTRGDVIKALVPYRRGDVLDVDDPELESVRWRLFGTGWFSDVRLRLRRGSDRGRVVLVVEVRERNTLVVQQIIAGISQEFERTTDRSVDIVPYGGLALAETNLLGLGVELSGTALVSTPQQGLRLDVLDPFAFGSSFHISAGGFYNNAREFFGDDDALVSIVCPTPDPEDPDPDPCPPEIEARSAVVFYQRLGLRLGTGREVGPSARYRLEIQTERIDVAAKPEAASERRGSAVTPIDFAIEDGVSWLSMLRLVLTHDKRDDPAFPARGTWVEFRADWATRLLHSHYDFLRAQAMARYWFPLAGDAHRLRLGLFGGIVFGRAPFFYRFYAADLSDLIPSRVLEMNLDHRPPPNLLGTSVLEMRAEEVAARADVEYGWVIRRGEGAFRAIELYASAGLFALADQRDLRVAISGYHGFARVPVDATFDLGVRADTPVGVFQLGFSNVLGFFTP